MSPLRIYAAAFVSLQSLRDLDYTVKDKMFFESVLDAEFEQVVDKGIFYNGACGF